MKTVKHPTIYVDTSAYLAVLLREPGYVKFMRKMKKGVLCSSVILLLEAQRNILRLSREKKISAKEFDLASQQAEENMEKFILRGIDFDLCSSKVFPLVSTPRTLDLIHLRTALWYHTTSHLEQFLSLDEGQLRAARELGLPTENLKN